MTFRPINDKQAGITSKTFSTFKGTHTGYSSLDMPDEYAFVCDVDCDDEKLKLRPGFKKVDSGNTASIEKVFQVELGGTKSVASVVNGSLSLRPLTDILAVVMAVLLSCLTPCVTTGATLYVFPANVPLNYKQLNTNFALLNVETTSWTNFLATNLWPSYATTNQLNTATNDLDTIIRAWANGQFLPLTWTNSVGFTNAVQAAQTQSGGGNPRAGIIGLNASKQLVALSAALEPEAGFLKINSAGQIVVSTNWWTDAWLETNAAGQIIARNLP